MKAGQGEIRVGVSTCLLGQHVRFDGGHKKGAFVTGPLARFVALVPVCPEVELRMGTPRESVRLVRRGDGVRMVGHRSGTDHTDAMRRWAEGRVSPVVAVLTRRLKMKGDRKRFAACFPR